MEKFLRKLALITHWLCFAISIAVIGALIVFNAELDGIFILMSLVFSFTSLLVGSAIRWMFSGRFFLLPWL